jgi:hypothetical protein
MKVIFKPQRIESYEAIQVTKDMIGKVLTDTPITKQEIVFEDKQLILRAHEIDNNDTYSSVQDIDIFLNEGDYLIKTPKGYMKPVNKVYEVDKQLERAIKHINEIK